MACSFQGVSLCYSFFCLLVSSVSGSRPDTKGTVEDTIFLILFRLICSAALWGGREGCCKQITLACARSASATLGLPPLTARVASLPTLLGLQVVLPGTIRGRPWAEVPGPSRSGSGTRVVLRGADSVGPAFCVLPRSEQLR